MPIFSPSYDVEIIRKTDDGEKRWTARIGGNLNTEALFQNDHNGVRVGDEIHCGLFDDDLAS